MLNKIYITLGAFLIGGYLGWSLMGQELTSSAREEVPSVTRSSMTGGGGRGGFGYFGSGYGYGK